MATAGLLVAAVSGCGGGNGDDPEASPQVKGPVARGTDSASPAQSQRPFGPVPMTLAAGRAQVELTSLSRTSGNTVTGQFKVSNDGSAELKLALTLFEGGQPTERRYGASGIGLLDGTGNKLYMPLWTADNKCLCSDLSEKVVSPGGSVDLYAVFPAPPADVRRVSVVMPHTVPLQDVPIATGPVRPLPDQTIDPATASLAPPRILPVGSTVEGDEQSTDEIDDDRAVRLSSDVLFAVNEAELSSRASALLGGVARQIDATTGNTVKVDGHTDTTGNDAINQPLSQRRARTVSRQLKRLVTRQGVTFRVAGHGSRDPVASNSTEQGRRKNRRVAVTFTRPLPKQTTSPSSGGEPYNLTKGDPPVLGSASFTAPEASGLKVEVNGLHRDTSGLTTLVWTVRNDRGNLVDISSRFTNFDSLSVSSAGTASGVELLDTARELHYQPMRTSEDRCLCSELIRFMAKARIGPGETVTYADIYKLPRELRTVDVRVPWSTSPGATVTGLSVK